MRTLIVIAVLFSAACAQRSWTVPLGHPSLDPRRQIAVSIKATIDTLPATVGCMEISALKDPTLLFQASADHEKVSRYEFIVTKPKDDPCYVGFVRSHGQGGHADSEAVRFAVVRLK